MPQELDIYYIWVTVRSGKNLLSLKGPLTGPRGHCLFLTSHSEQQITCTASTKFVGCTIYLNCRRVHVPIIPATFYLASFPDPSREAGVALHKHYVTTTPHRTCNNRAKYRQRHGNMWNSFFWLLQNKHDAVTTTSDKPCNIKITAAPRPTAVIPVALCEKWLGTLSWNMACSSLFSSLMILCCAIYGTGAIRGVDISTPVSAMQFSCLYDGGYRFANIRAYESGKWS